MFLKDRNMILSTNSLALYTLTFNIIFSNSYILFWFIDIRTKVIFCKTLNMNYFIYVIVDLGGKNFNRSSAPLSFVSTGGDIISALGFFNLQILFLSIYSLLNL